MNAIVPFWELPVLPGSWVDVCRGMDHILAPSAFVAEAVERSIGPGGPDALRLPQAVSAPEHVVADPKRWLGDRGGSFAVLTLFDVHSAVARKNPWAAVEAFAQAFLGRDDVTLVVKVSGFGTPGAPGDQSDCLHRMADEDPRIVLIEQNLDRDSLWSLHRSVDAFLSLHRSEGLGLGPMESMACGKCVVATGWSGNMDFMDVSNSFPVPFRLVPVEGVAGIAAYAAHAQGQTWAEPDVAVAADALRDIANDAGLRQRLGSAALERIRVLREEQMQADVLRQVVESAEAVRNGSAHARRAALLARQGDRVRFRRRMVEALRTVGLKPPGPLDEVPVSAQTAILRPPADAR